MVAVAVAYYSGRESITFPVKGNINPPYNQAMIVIDYKDKWIGGYSFQDSVGNEIFRQELNGTGNLQLTINRPNNTTPWIVHVLVQGVPHAQKNLTVSIFLVNGTIIDSVTKNSERYAMPISIIIANMDTLTSSHS